MHRRDRRDPAAGDCTPHYQPRHCQPRRASRGLIGRLLGGAGRHALAAA